jgi:phosphoesterase RecJ-like protein
LPREAAQPLYAAIVADTGGFRYSQTRPDTLRLAARLLELGVDPWEVASRLFERWAPARMALLGEVLRTMQLELDGRVALVTVDRAMLDRAGASEEMIEGMVNYGRMLDGVLAAALLWEPRSKEGREVKLSLRAATGTDVARVAVALGGGGHRSAAGATLRGPLDEARARVLEALAAALPPPITAS